jgi:TP901 family phage tail tape measure protein
MAFDVSWVYQIIDRYTGPLKKIKKVTDSAKRAINGTSKALKGMSQKLLSVGNAVGGIAALSAIVFPTKKAIAFQDSMIDVQKVMDFKTPEAFEKFREGIFKTAVELGKTPEAIAKIAFEGKKIGIMSKDLNHFIKLVGRTSVAFDMLEGPAAETLGSIKTKLSLNIQETEDMMDAINFLADNTATSGKRAIEVVSRTVGTMKTIKMPPELVAGFAAYADQLSVSPELAASGLNMMVVRMMKMPGMMKKLLADPKAAIRDTLGKFAKMSELKRSRMVMKKFGDEAGRFVLKAVSSMDLLDKTLGLVGERTKFAGSMMKELEKKMKGASTSIGKIRAVADVAFIQIGDALLPIIKDLTPAIISVVTSIRMFIKQNPMIVKIGLALIAILGVLMAMSIVLGVLATGFSIMLSPITLIIAAVAALAFGINYLWKNSEMFRFVILKAKDGFLAWLDNLKKIVGVFIKIGKWQFDKIVAWYNIIKSVLSAIMSIYSWFHKISNMGFENIKGMGTSVMKFITGDESTAAENALLKGQINGRIEVAASRGSEIKRAEIDHSSSGNLGFNMGL